VFSSSDISLKSIPEELERSSSLDEEVSVEFEEDVVAEDVVALEEDSFACELEEPADTLDEDAVALEEVVALEESPVLEEELLPEEFPLEEDDSADADSAEEYSISVSELSGSSCSAPVAELSLSPQDASNKAKKMQ
jgi:hypothetical protein